MRAADTGARSALQGTPGGALAVVCGQDGYIHDVLHDHMVLSRRHPAPGRLADIVEAGSVQKLSECLAEAWCKGASLGWEIALCVGQQFEPMSFFAVRRGESMVVFAVQADQLSFSTFEEMLRLTDKQGADFSLLGNQLPGHSPLSGPELDEFTKLNNEMLNAQREFIKGSQLESQRARQEKEALFERLFDHSPVGSAIVGLDFMFQRVNDELCRITGYTRHELEGKGFPYITHPDDLLFDTEQATQLAAGHIDQYSSEKRFLCKDGGIVWIHLSMRLIRDDKGLPQYYLPMIKDIGERKRMEEESHRQTKVLEDRARELQDMNSALRVLLDQREKDRSALHEQVLTNMRLLILPYIERIREECPKPNVERHLQSVRRTFEEITSSFARTLSAEYRALTANEIRVADLIRSGLTCKEISSMLSISQRTVEYYRACIRRKLGLTDRTISLYSYLHSLA